VTNYVSYSDPRNGGNKLLPYHFVEEWRQS